MDFADNKSIKSLDAPSLASMGSRAYDQYVPSNFFSGPKDNVKVVIRLRPLNDREKNSGNGKKCVSVENTSTIIVDAKPDNKVFNFDFVGHETLDQESVFNQIAKPIADSCLEGYNGSIFAYGQTGAGKTFTIQGTGLMLQGSDYFEEKLTETEDYEKRGLMSRSFEYIFDSIQKAKAEAEASKGEQQFEYLVRCSYLEIYNEQIMDLLEPSAINLHIREDIKKGVYVEGLSEEVVTSAQDMIDMTLRGSKNRHVGSTSMNKESSRSHSVLTTIIETKSMREGGGLWNIKSSRFHIIDLAGSERQKFTNAMGDRLKEAGMINKSLSALGNVINSLVDISEGKNRHVHYRDSKLTFLLRDSLGGNSKTLIIANISPSQACHGETLSTLKFAQRAKLIRNKAVINEDSSGTIQILKQEINRLKKELAESEQRSQLNNMQCAFCRNNINGDPMMEDDVNEDEYLLDQSMLNQSINFSSTITNALEKDESGINNGKADQINDQVQKKLKQSKVENQGLRKRIVYLEGLLSANLDNLTSQQKFYDSELQKSQQQHKRLALAVDSYEKQCARDKMIIKFREDRIQKLESHQTLTQDEKTKQIQDLKKEIQVWKDAVDHNPQSAKLFAEKADLLKQLDQMKKESKQTPDSLNAQMRSLIELNEGLNEYLKQYCEESKKEVEQELSRVRLDYGEKLEELNLKIDQFNQKEQEWQSKCTQQEQEYNHIIASLKSEIDSLKERNIQEKAEIERLNKEQFEQIKKEIEEISENKTEQEKEASVLKVQLMEKEREFERESQKKEEIINDFQAKETKLIESIQNLESNKKDLEQVIQRDKEQARQTIEDLNHQLETEKKQFQAKYKQNNEHWEKKLKELETQFMVEQNERELIQEQSEQMSNRIKQLESENETFQQTLLCKEEEIQELSRQIKQGEQELEQMKNSEKEDKEKIASKEREVGNLRNELAKVIKDSEDLKEGIKEIRQEIEEQQKEKEELEKTIKVKEQQIDQMLRVNEQLKGEIEEQETVITKLREELQEQVDMFYMSQNSQSKEFQSKIEELQNEKVLLEKVVREKECEIMTIQEEANKNVETIKQERVKIEEKMKEEIKQVINDKAQLEQSFKQEVQRIAEEKQSIQTEMEVEIEKVRQENTQFKEVVSVENEKKIAILEQEKTQLKENYIRETQALEEKLNVEHQQQAQELQKMLEQTFQQRVEKLTNDAKQQFEHFKEENEKEVQIHKNTIIQLQKSLNDQYQTVVQSNSEATEKINSLKLQMSKQEQEFNEKVKLFELQSKDIQQQKEKQVIDLKQSYHQKETQLALDFEIQRKQLEDEKSKLQQNLEKKEKELQDTKSHYNDIISKFEHEVQEHSNKVQLLTQENSNLNEEASTQVKHLSEELKSKHEQLEELRDLWKEQKQINENQSHTIENSNKEYKQIQQKFSQVTKERNDLKQSEQTLTSKLQQLQQEYTKLKKDSEQQKKQLESSISSLNSDHSKKFQELQQEAQSNKNALQVEIDTYKQHCKDLNMQLAKQRQKTEEYNENLRQCKDTISGMVIKENDLMQELEKKINELKDHQDKWKQRLQETKEEKDALKKEWDRMKKENENLRELVKLKDRQIEEQLNQDEKDRDQQEKLFRENKDLRTQLTKREFEMKEVVRTLKFYSEEKTRLEKELEKLHRENDQLIGHKNPSQKIQHHLKIKEENNKLREENLKLQEELRRKTDILIKKGISMSKDQSPAKPFQPTNENIPQEGFCRDDLKKLKKENMTIQENMNRLVDHILSQPGLMKIIGISDDIYDKIQQSQGQSKVKNAMEVISLFNNVIQNKERELKDAVREKKKLECRIDIIEKEKNLCKAQIEIVQNSSNSEFSYGNKNQNQQDYMMKNPSEYRRGSSNQISQQQLDGMKSQERLQNEYHQQKQVASPFQGYRQLPNMKSKEFVGPRSSSGIRGGQQYLNSNTQK